MSASTIDTLRYLVLSISLAIPMSGAAQSADIQGPVSRVALVELFTSEGCSSCPPAEKWLNRTEARSDLWSRVVPVAFHVDYWDYIGWPDRFAAREHSIRQRTYRKIGHTSGVYTPGFLVGGREWRGWFRDPTLELPAAVDVGAISVSVQAGRFDARFEPAVEAPESLELHVARLGFDLATEVRAGENHGRTLEHGFVVLGWSRHPMHGDGASLEASGTLPAASNPAPREAVAVWVSVPGDPFPIQAAGAWLAN